jgi:hypothetical protein
VNQLPSSVGGTSKPLPSPMKLSVLPAASVIRYDRSAISRG